MMDNRKPSASAEYITRPQQVAFCGEIAPGWRLIRELPITIDEDDNGSYIVSDDIFYVYGEGDTLEEAHNDYIQSLVEYYEILAQHSDEPTQQLLSRLSTYLHHTADA
jgi:hypothetical protein